jgi:hypothetical protein
MTTRRRRHKPRELDPTDPSDLVRRLEARIAFVGDSLLKDPRVKAAFVKWADSSDGRHAIAAIVVRTDDLLFGSQRLGVEEHWPIECEDLGRRLLSSIDWHGWPLWVAPYLGWLSIRFAYSMVMGSVPPWIHQLQQPWASRKQRAIKRDPVSGVSTIPRDVAWFYQTQIQSPRRTIGQLAREYKAQFHGRDDAKSVIRDGIRRAKRALEIA